MQYKTVSSYPNYEVSNCGKVRNKKTGRVLRPLVLTKGYLGVRLYHDGNGKTLKIHRLVSILFVDGYFEGAQVNHIDGDKTNNHAGNLEWCTGQQNHDHKMVNGLNVATHKFSSMTHDKVIELHLRGVSQRKIAEVTLVSKSTIGKWVVEYKSLST